MEKRLKQEEQVIIIIYDDLIIDILSRLPVKSLLRFRSVSKKWKDLISSSSLRILHRERNTSSPPLLVGFNPGYRLITCCDLYGRIVQQLTLPTSLNKDFLMMNVPYQSKLVCFRNVYSSRNRYISYNPITQHCVQLPEPQENLVICGSTLGYIQSKDEYMLVHLSRLETSFKDPWVCQILTMSISRDNFQLQYTPEWRSLKETLPRHHVHEPVGVFVCGAFYWTASDSNIQELCVLSLDIETEVFSTFGFPQPIRNWHQGILMELKDELFYLDETIMMLTAIQLWKFDGNKSWTLYKSIKIESLGLYKNTVSLKDILAYQMRLTLRRLEYLQYYKKPYKFSCEMGMLKIKEGEEEEGAVLIDYEERGGYQIHTNLFTL